MNLDFQPYFENAIYFVKCERNPLDGSGAPQKCSKKGNAALIFENHSKNGGEKFRETEIFLLHDFLYYNIGLFLYYLPIEFDINF